MIFWTSGTCLTNPQSPTYHELTCTTPQKKTVLKLIQHRVHIAWKVRYQSLRTRISAGFSFAIV